MVSPSQAKSQVDDDRPLMPYETWSNSLVSRHRAVHPEPVRDSCGERSVDKRVQVLRKAKPGTDLMIWLSGVRTVSDTVGLQ